MAQKAELKGKINLDSSGFQRGIAKSKKSVGTFVATLKGSLLPALGAAGAAGALVSYGRKAIESASQITELAKVSGVGVVEFQKLAEAAKTVNIGQEKLADIFKDTSDKMGDFLQVGSGAMVDFFEKIAPLVGATREEFIGLSGKDSLQKYVDYLEQANIPHADMIFYMEAIASDASMLIPLLEDGGTAFRELGEGAEAAGNFMDKTTIKALKRAENNIDRFQQNITVFVGQIIGALSPAAGAFDELAEAQLRAEGALKKKSKFTYMGDPSANKKIEIHNDELIKQRAEQLELDALAAKLNRETQAKVEQVARLAAQAKLDAIEAKEKADKKAAQEKAKAEREAAKTIRDKEKEIRDAEKAEKDAERAAEEAKEKAAAKKISDAKLELLKAEAAEESALIVETKKQLELEESIQDIMASTNLGREEAVSLAEKLAKANAGADANQSGYTTPREQRAAERKERKEAQAQRARERAERAAEVGAGERSREADRSRRFTTRERQSGMFKYSMPDEAAQGGAVDPMGSLQGEGEQVEPGGEVKDKMLEFEENKKEQMEKQVEYLENIDKRLEKLDSALSGD